jgi:hypothetical protein
MKQPDSAISPIRRQATEALKRARKLPIGQARNDLRQLALGLRWLERKGFVAIVEDRDSSLRATKETPSAAMKEPPS